MADQSLREEFRPSRLSLNHPQPDRFLTSQWTTTRGVYLAWRVACCVGLVALLIVSGVLLDQGARWLVSLGHWTLLLAALTFTLDLLNVLCFPIVDQADVTESQDVGQGDTILFHAEFILVDGIKQRTLSRPVQVVWCLYSVVNSLTIVWTVVFWALDYNGSSETVDMVTTTVTPVLLLINVMITAMPVQILHAIFPVIMAAVYVIFTAIYHACGGSHLDSSDHVFPGIDWDESFPTVVTVILGLVIVVPLGHLVTFALYTFKVYLHSRVHFSSYSPSFPPSTDKGSSVSDTSATRSHTGGGTSSDPHPRLELSEATASTSTGSQRPSETGGSDRPPESDGSNQSSETAMGSPRPGGLDVTVERETQRTDHGL